MNGPGLSKLVYGIDGRIVAGCELRVAGCGWRAGSGSGTSKTLTRLIQKRKKKRRGVYLFECLITTIGHESKPMGALGCFNHTLSTSPPSPSLPRSLPRCTLSSPFLPPRRRQRRRLRTTPLSPANDTPRQFNRPLLHRQPIMLSFLLPAALASLAGALFHHFPTNPNPTPPNAFFARY